MVKVSLVCGVSGTEATSLAFCKNGTSPVGSHVWWGYAGMFLAMLLCAYWFTLWVGRRFPRGVGSSHYGAPECDMGCCDDVSPRQINNFCGVNRIKKHKSKKQPKTSMGNPPIKTVEHSNLGNCESLSNTPTLMDDGSKSRVNRIRTWDETSIWGCRFRTRKCIKRWVAGGARLSVAKRFGARHVRAHALTDLRKRDCTTCNIGKQSKKINKTNKKVHIIHTKRSRNCWGKTMPWGLMGLVLFWGLCAFNAIQMDRDKTTHSIHNGPWGTAHDCTRRNRLWGSRSEGGNGGYMTIAEVSIIHCSHYVQGVDGLAYGNSTDAPNVSRYKDPNFARRILSSKKIEISPGNVTPPDSHAEHELLPQHINPQYKRTNVKTEFIV